jgi:hypothetical protein
MAKFEFVGLGRLMSGLSALQNPDPRPVLAKWQVIIEQDNERGVLAGTDKDGKPMRPVTYRPIKSDKQKWTKKREAQHAKGVTSASGDNLTSGQYRRLTGPPLAPRGKSSRAIANLETGQGYDSSAGVFYAEGAWKNVVSKKGVPFLEAHFTGADTGRCKLPQRDLRGLRPWGRMQCLKALQEWGRDLLRGLWA